MNRREIQELLAQRPVVLDGSTGSELVKRGLPPGACPEKWVLENPDAILDLHRAYRAAGSDIVLSCTFGANRLKLADHGLESAVHEMNVELVRLSRSVLEGLTLFGDMSPTGAMVEPFGELPFEEAVAVFREQARALLAGGVDGFMIETMFDLQEARAALLAVREVSDLPVFVSMTFDEGGASISGTPPEAALVSLQALGADAVGCNCSSGPGGMRRFVEAMLPYARVPLIAKPNAGTPRAVDGTVRYDVGPEEFAAAMEGFAGMGARILGGCCGTTPDHIRALVDRLDGKAISPPPPPARSAVSSARGAVDLAIPELEKPGLLVIGERINPTGKKAFQAELLAGDLSGVDRFAEEQTAAGAALLDVNLGLGGLDEPAAMRQAVAMLSVSSTAPLSVDTVSPDAMERSLRLYPGRALVNSISAEKDRLEKLLPVAARYGAALIVLPVGEGFIPGPPSDRLAVAREILAETSLYRIPPADLLVDGLAMTVSADPLAGGNTLDFLDLCARELRLQTVVGLSNVSFGMPERKWLNAVFLAMATARGLRAVIANPSAELIRETGLSANVLAGAAGGVAAYLKRFAPKPDAGPRRGGESKILPREELAARAVLKGEYAKVAALTRDALRAGVPAGTLVADHLVPAIIRAGDLFEQKKYYLPQLMLAGEAMRRALAEAEPDLERERGTSGTELRRGAVVMATVKGDVHDIGKNLVSLMLRNHGFEVVDLGKDVPAEAIIQTAKERGAGIVGLSALMTTTLASMRDTIAQCRDAGLAVKYMVGGAAVTEAFAAEIGADAYAEDAVRAVKAAERLTGVIT